MAATGVGAFLGAVAVATLIRTERRGQILVASVAVFSLSLFVFALSTVFWLSLVMLAIIGCSMVIYMTTANTELQTSVPETLRGRVMSVWTLTAFGLTPLGSLQAGAIANSFGAPFALVFGAALCGLAVVLAAAKTADLRAGS
jgi:predicted MFS family arabinose efflux permease